PSHRNCGYPDWIAANIKKNAIGAKIAPNGWSLQQAALPGVPFPLPKTGIEVLWNYIAKYRGMAVEMQDDVTLVSPKPGHDEWIETHGPQTEVYLWAKRGAVNPADINQIQKLY